MRIGLVAAVILIALIVTGVWASVNPEAKLKRSVEVGMTEAQVLRSMGEPDGGGGMTMNIGTLEELTDDMPVLWKYGDCSVTFISGKVSSFRCK